MVNNVALVDFRWEAEGTIAMTLTFLSWLDEQLAAGENGNRVAILTGQMTTPKTDNIPCFPSEADIMKRLSSGYICVVCFVPTAFKNMHQINDILFFPFSF